MTDPIALPDLSAISRPADVSLHTAARIALATTGVSLATRPALEFSLAHAQARDAVHSAIAVPTLLAALRARSLPAIHLRSAAASRAEYLRRPDLGRTLAPASAALLASQPAAGSVQPSTLLTLVLADGLSALATDRHAIAVLDALLPLLRESWTLTPTIVAEQARVALADPIGHALGAAATVILIGERPGLSSPDSLGAYITWAPRPGRTDAERNCVSNIRPSLAGQPSTQAGLDYSAAAVKIAWYLNQGRRLGLTGVALREQDAPPALAPPAPRGTLD